MPFDAAHQCAVSQVNLSILLCLRYHGHVTMQKLLIVSCKKEWVYSKSSLNLMRIHIWTPWFDIWFFGFVKINTSNKMTSFCLLFSFVFDMMFCLMFKYYFCKSIDLMSMKKVTCPFPLMPLIDVQCPRSTSQYCCAWGAMYISLLEYCWLCHAKRIGFIVNPALTWCRSIFGHLDLTYSLLIL